MFNEEKKGYSKSEVDRFIKKKEEEHNRNILNLRTRITELEIEASVLKRSNNELKQREDNVKEALVLAVEKAKEAEEKAKSEYLGEVEKLKHLYFKWVKIIEDAKNKYGLINSNELNAKAFQADIENLLSKTINEEIKREDVQMPNHEGANMATKPEVVPAHDNQKYYHKQLLNRMSGLLYSVSNKVRGSEEPHLASKFDAVPTPEELIEKQRLEKESVLDETEQQFVKETNRLSNLSNENYEETKIKQQDEPKEHKFIGYSSILSKYLSDDGEGELASAYAKKITNNLNEKQVTANLNKELKLPESYPMPNETGFNLREAVNPKESLDEIMKSFDFFGDEN